MEQPAEDAGGREQARVGRDQRGVRLVGRVVGSGGHGRYAVPRMPPFKTSDAYRPTGDQPGAIAGPVRRDPRGRALPDAPRRHRHRQDGHDGLGHRADPAAGARDRPQQDARRAALQRVPGVLPGQRGRVLRLVLRLLPARGVRPAGRPLHREGLVPERRHRPAAPRGDVEPPDAPRHDRRRLRLLHLRPRLAGGVREEDGAADGRRGDRARPDAAQADRHPVRAQRHAARPRPLPGQGRRRSRSSPRTRRRRTASRSSATRSRRSRTSTRSRARSSRSSTTSPSFRRRSTSPRSRRSSAPSARSSTSSTSR